MTQLQLFREVYMELHPGQCTDEIFKMADSVVPNVPKDEIPENQVEIYRTIFLAIAREVDAKPIEESREWMAKYLSKN